MPFGLHTKTPVPSRTSRAPAQFLAQNTKESRSASLTRSHSVALGGTRFVSTTQILLKKSEAERVVENAVLPLENLTHVDGTSEILVCLSLA